MVENHEEEEIITKIKFHAFTVDVPDGWEVFAAPIDTLALPDGVGALQFSVALFAGGEPPLASLEDLFAMLNKFGITKGFGDPVEVVTEAGDLLLAAGSYRWEEDFLRVWQISDGANFAFATYVCQAGEEPGELVDCERIVRTFKFRTSSYSQKYLF